MAEKLIWSALRKLHLPSGPRASVSAGPPISLWTPPSPCQPTHSGSAAAASPSEEAPRLSQRQGWGAGCIWSHSSAVRHRPAALFANAQSRNKTSRGTCMAAQCCSPMQCPVQRAGWGWFQAEHGLGFFCALSVGTVLSEEALSFSPGRLKPQLPHCGVACSPNDQQHFRKQEGTENSQRLTVPVKPKQQLIRSSY